MAENRGKNKTFDASNEEVNHQDELIKYKYKINNILESFTEAFFEVDLNWTIIYWNKESERILSKSREEVLGKNLWEVFSKAVSLKFYTQYHKAIKDNVAVRFEEYWPEKKIWIEASAFPSGESLSVYFRNITAWRNVTRQLKKEKKRYYDLFNHSPLPQWVYDFKSLKILHVNDAAIKQYGYSRKQFLKLTILDLRLPEDANSFRQVLNDKILKGKFNSSVVRHVKKNGELIYVRVDGNSVFFDDRNSRLVMAVDQTEQINAELELAKSEQRFKALIQDGSDLIAILDKHGKYTYVSPTTKQILGVVPEKFLGKNAFEFIHPDDKPLIAEEFDQLNTKKRIQLSPFRFLNNNGQYIWIETILTNLLDDPVVNGIISNSRDITQRVQYEQNTKELLDRYNIVSKATSDAIWDWDILTGKIHWNLAVSTLFGYGLTDYNFTWWEQQIHPEDRERVLGQFSQLLKSKKSRLQLEYRFRCADGEYKCVLDRSFVVFNHMAKPIRMIGSMQDITERIQHVKDIEEKNLRLKEISWSQAHNVRAPLAKILGLVALLEGENDPEALNEIVGHLKSSATDLDQVIKGIINKPH